MRAQSHIRIVAKRAVKILPLSKMRTRLQELFYRTAAKALALKSKPAASLTHAECFTYSNRQFSQI
jgi:hypothetical protein